ncbi:hypothetical protein H206_00319 [Candidatus Electrothrix aarhusensis]|jgi:hypothetical protein|uniref:Uncharacterized protein n=1 Tax=Candidatus Electrothrix aarhusensis TaxID=1859131 RepID=A0A3S3QG23_9BACT|nr:hypothetical protein H206_00319 [Candidatus Electrothrix aarhusensis]
MGFDIKQASNTMNLVYVPTKKEKEENIKTCHICLKSKDLTYEHVPPKKAYNQYNKLWDRLQLKKNISSRTFQARGGFRVHTLCKSCNNEICSLYAKEYISMVKQLVEKPQIFDKEGEAKIFSIEINRLFVAKEIATMILATEPLSFARHNYDLRKFVLDKTYKSKPGFKVLSFLVPNSIYAGTISKTHGRVDTYAPGFKLTGGEISWFPFGIVYASEIGEGYNLSEFLDISNWFFGNNVESRNSIMVKLYTRLTGIESLQSLVHSQRNRPQIDDY